MFSILARMIAISLCAARTMEMAGHSAGSGYSGARFRVSSHSRAGQARRVSDLRTDTQNIKVHQRFLCFETLKHSKKLKF